MKRDPLPLQPKMLANLLRNSQQELRSAEDSDPDSSDPDTVASFLAERLPLTAEQIQGFDGHLYHFMISQPPEVRRKALHHGTFFHSMVAHSAGHYAAELMLLDLALGSNLEGRTILEIAANHGDFGRFLQSHRGTPGWGIDINALAIEYAKTRPISTPLQCASVTNIPYAQGIWDAVVSRGFPDHADLQRAGDTTHPSVYLTAMANALNPHSHAVAIISGPQPSDFECTPFQHAYVLDLSGGPYYLASKHSEGAQLRDIALSSGNRWLIGKNCVGENPVDVNHTKKEGSLKANILRIEDPELVGAGK